MSVRLLHIGLNAISRPYNGVQKAFSSKTVYKEVSIKDKNFRDKLIDVSKSFKPDILFMQIQGDGVVDKDLLKKVKKNVGVIMNWTGDVRTPIPKFYYDVAPHVLTLFSNMHDVRKMKKEGYNVDYLQIGYDRDIFYPKGSELKLQPIVFLGNNYKDRFPLSKERHKMCVRMKEEFGKDFGIYGNSWGEMATANFNDFSLLEAALYRGCKIAINYSHFNYDRYFSDRLLRIMGTGTFCLSHNYKGIEKDFTNKELVCFDNLDDLVKKAKYYLKNEKIRNKIGDMGEKKVREVFTYESMAENIIKLWSK